MKPSYIITAFKLYESYYDFCEAYCRFCELRKSGKYNMIELKQREDCGTYEHFTSIEIFCK